MAVSLHTRWKSCWRFDLRGRVTLRNWKSCWRFDLHGGVSDTVAQVGNNRQNARKKSSYLRGSKNKPLLQQKQEMYGLCVRHDVPCVRHTNTRTAQRHAETNNKSKEETYCEESQRLSGLCRAAKSRDSGGARVAAKPRPAAACQSYTPCESCSPPARCPARHRACSALFQHSPHRS